MALTVNDLIQIENILDDKLDEKLADLPTRDELDARLENLPTRDEFNERVRLLPTREEFLDSMDKLITFSAN